MLRRDSETFRRAAAIALTGFLPLATGCTEGMNEPGATGEREDAVEIRASNGEGIADTLTLPRADLIDMVVTAPPPVTVDGEALEEPARLLRLDAFDLGLPEGIVLSFERDGDTFVARSGDAEGRVFTFTWDADLEWMEIESARGPSTVELRGVEDREVREAFFGRLLVETALASDGESDGEVAYLWGFVIRIVAGFFVSLAICMARSGKCDDEARRACGSAGVARVDADCRGGFIWRLVCTVECNADGGPDDDQCAWTDLYGNCIIAY